PWQSRRDLQLRAERAREPHRPRTASLRASDDRQREPAWGSPAPRDPLEPSVALCRNDAELPLPRTPRLCVRHRSSSRRLPQARRTQAPVRRRLRPLAFELSRSGSRTRARPLDPLVRPLPQGHPERGGQGEARAGRLRSLEWEDRELRRPALCETNHADVEIACDTRSTGQARPHVQVAEAQRRTVRSAGVAGDGCDRDPVAAPGGSSHLGRCPRAGDDRERGRHADRVRPRRAHGLLQAHLGRESHSERLEAPRVPRCDVDGSERREPALPQARAGRVAAHGREGDLDAADSSEDDLSVISHLAAAAAAIALGAPAATPGVTPTQITLGATIPITGPAAAYGSVGRGADAYFKYVNSKGGVFGRKIDYKYLDDEFDVAKTISLTRQLVEQDQVFAIFNSVGTEHALAIRSYLNERKVPQLFLGSGVSKLATEHAKYPWSMGYLPSFAGEGAVYGRYIAAHQPKARIGVLYENSDFGKDMLNGLRRGLKGRAKIVGAQSYEITDNDVPSQIAKLKSSGADTL